MAGKGSAGFGEIGPENWSFSSDEGKENEPPSAKRVYLSLKKERKCFKAVSRRTLKELATQYPSKNTQANTNWAMRNLTTWFE